MNRFLGDWRRREPRHLAVWAAEGDEAGSGPRPPSRARVLALGPHPDDPESVAVACRLLAGAGCEIWYSIATMSASGVEDAYLPAGPDHDPAGLTALKIEIRREEQRRAAARFGLPAERLTFLDLLEEERGGVSEVPDNRAHVRDHLEVLDPDIVMLPAGRDTNRTHVWVHDTFRECARALVPRRGRPMAALYNEDPKTTEIRPDLFVTFGEQAARWKGALLRVHDSQQQRNLRVRGQGFDERILALNRLGHRRLAELEGSEDRSDRYAEVFEVELFDLS